MMAQNIIVIACLFEIVRVWIHRTGTSKETNPSNMGLDSSEHFHETNTSAQSITTIPERSNVRLRV